MIIKNHAVGINASDVNFTAGAYLPGVRQGFELTKIYQKINVNVLCFLLIVTFTSFISPPFTVGFEAVGTVVAAGAKAMAKEGDYVAYMENGAFTEYQTTRRVFPIPSLETEYIPLLVSGLTAAIALKVNGIDVFHQNSDSKPPRIGLVTAAAGGTGMKITINSLKNRF